MKYELRDYQKVATDRAINCLETKKNGILVLPTGSGKSLIIASIVERMGGHTIILQPTKEILEQNKEKMESFVNWDIGVYSASMGQKTIGRITFATIGSVVNQKDLFGHFDRIIIDECHRVNSKGGIYEDFITTLKKSCIGLTATPYRLRSYKHFATGEPTAESRILTRTRPRIFQKISHITQVKALFESKHLCPLNYDWQNNYDSKKIRNNSTGQGFNETALERYNESQQIVEKIIKIASSTRKKHCLVFTKFISESKKVIDGLEREKVSCAEISGKTHRKDRASILTQFRNGNIKCVVNVGVLTTGFDFPELDCIVIGRPTKSVSLYYQMIGRGVRLARNKDNCMLFDLCDNVKRFGKIETFEIYDQNNNGMWRLKSDKGNLTGVDVSTGTNLEKVNNAPKRVDGEIIMPFGKYKDKKLSDVDKGYLEWAIDNFDSGKWKSAFKKELKKRAG